MKILIIQKDDFWWFDGVGQSKIYNEETWLFKSDDIKIKWSDWLEYRKDNPKAKLYEYLESLGGTLLPFEEIQIIN